MKIIFFKQLKPGQRFRFYSGALNVEYTYITNEDIFYLGFPAHKYKTGSGLELYLIDTTIDYYKQKVVLF